MLHLGCDRETAGKYLGWTPAQLRSELKNKTDFSREVLRAEGAAEFHHLRSPARRRPRKPRIGAPRYGGWNGWLPSDSRRKIGQRRDRGRVAAVSRMRWRKRNVTDEINRRRRPSVGCSTSLARMADARSYADLKKEFSKQMRWMLNLKTHRPDESTEQSDEAQ